MNLIRLFLIAALISLPAAASAETPRVAVSIQPLHSLAAGVMAEVGEPVLLLPAGASPHAYQMRPSDAAALYSADLVFWFGVPLENFLQAALANVRPRSRVIGLLNAPGLELLSNRESGVFEPADGHGHAHSRPGGESGRDPHVWLSPEHAKRLARHMAHSLAEMDPDNAPRYETNAQSLFRRIDLTASEIDALLAPVRSRPFIMFHDAFQYFESAFGLRAAGALHLEPNRVPGARRISELRAVIRDHGVRCVFREPQFHAALVDTLIEGTGARIGVVDPLGADLAPGPEAWFRMMRANAEAMAECLEGR